MTQFSVQASKGNDNTKLMWKKWTELLNVGFPHYQNRYRQVRGGVGEGKGEELGGRIRGEWGGEEGVKESEIKRKRAPLPLLRWYQTCLLRTLQWQKALFEFWLYVWCSKGAGVMGIANRFSLFPRLDENCVMYRHLQTTTFSNLSVSGEHKGISMIILSFFIFKASHIVT